MIREIKVPILGESVTEATVSQWLKQQGQAVKEDEPLVELETDKVTLEVSSPVDGVLMEICVPEGEDVNVDALLARVNSQGKATQVPEQTQAPDLSPSPQPVVPPSPQPVVDEKSEDHGAVAGPSRNGAYPLSPAVRKLVDEHGLNPQRIPSSGKDGRLLKGDVLNYLQRPAQAHSSVAPDALSPTATLRDLAQGEERVKMTKLRQTIARRLKTAQNNAAILTTYNEVDMTQLLAFRRQHKEAFEKKHAIKLGFMSFFVKACTLALQEWPAVNGEIEGQSIIYKKNVHVGVAVGTPQGLVVPVVRDTQDKSFAQIEKQIARFAEKAKSATLSLDDMSGGSFTISNGGVYGSLLSSPILNTPQSAILGMHKTQMRPVVIDGQVVARPMMYLALSYDHRLIDGREAVSFLVRVKECIENPERILLEC